MARYSFEEFSDAIKYIAKNKATSYDCLPDSIL